jgi:uncharacterized UPF0146 family protein
MPEDRSNPRDGLIADVAQAMRDANSPDAWPAGSATVPFEHFARVAVDHLVTPASEVNRGTDITYTIRVPSDHDEELTSIAVLADIVGRMPAASAARALRYLRARYEEALDGH